MRNRREGEMEGKEMLEFEFEFWQSFFFFQTNFGLGFMWIVLNLNN